MAYIGLMASSIKRQFYTFALSDMKQCKRVIKLVEQYPKYAYILHDEDKGADHYHFYVEFTNPRHLSAVAKELKIPENMIEIVRNKKAILEYLTHKNDPDKYHYFEENIVTNMDIKKEVKGNKLTYDDLCKEYDDWLAVKRGQMTMKEFFLAHNDSFTTLSIRGRVEIYEKAGTGGLSPVPASTFHNRDSWQVN